MTDSLKSYKIDLKVDTAGGVVEVGKLIDKLKASDVPLESLTKSLDKFGKATYTILTAAISEAKAAELSFSKLSKEVSGLSKLTIGEGIGAKLRKDLAELDKAIKKIEKDLAEANKLELKRKTSLINTETSEKDLQRLSQLKIDEAIRSGNQIKVLQLKAAEDERRLAVATSKAILAEYEKARAGQSWIKTTGNINTIQRGDTASRSALQTQLFADIQAIKNRDASVKQHLIDLEATIKAAQKQMLFEAYSYNDKLNAIADAAEKARKERAKQNLIDLNASIAAAYRKMLYEAYSHNDKLNVIADTAEKARKERAKQNLANLNASVVAANRKMLYEAYETNDRINAQAKQLEQTRLSQFSQFLKDREALLRADINTQRQVEISGMNSIEAHRARANQQRLAEEQRYRAQIRAIDANVKAGGSSALGQTQATTAMTAYLAALKLVDAQLAVHEKAVQNTETAHKAMWLRVVEVTAVYRLWTTAIQYGQQALMSVPTTGIHYEGTVASLTAITGSITLAHREMAFLKFEADRTGLGLDNLRESFRQFSASAKTAGESTKTIENIFANVNTMATTLHLSTDQVNGTFLALSQMFSKGKVQAEELVKQLSNSIPGAVSLMAKAYQRLGESQGKTFKSTSEALKSLLKDMKLGQVMAHDLVPLFAEEAGKLYGGTAFEHASTGLNATIGRLSTAWTQMTENLYKATSEAMLGVVKWVTTGIESVKTLTSDTYGLKQSMILFGETAKNVFYAFSVVGLALALNGLIKLSQTIGLVAGALNLIRLHPVMLGIAALTAGAVAYSAWNDQKERANRLSADVHERFVFDTTPQPPAEVKKSFDYRAEQDPDVVALKSKSDLTLNAWLEAARKDNDAITEALRITHEEALFSYEKSKASVLAKLKEEAESETLLNEVTIQAESAKKQIAKLQTEIERAKQTRASEKALMEADMKLSVGKPTHFKFGGKELTYPQYSAREDIKALQEEKRLQEDILKITKENPDSKDAIGKQENLIKALNDKILLTGKEGDILDAKEQRALKTSNEKLRISALTLDNKTKEAQIAEINLKYEEQIFSAQENRQLSLIPGIKANREREVKLANLTEPPEVVANRKLKLEADSLSIPSLSSALAKAEVDYKEQSLELLKKGNTERQKYLDLIFKGAQEAAKFADAERKSTEAASFFQIKENELSLKKLSGMLTEKQYLDELQKAREDQLPSLEAQLKLAEASTQEEGKQLKILQLKEQMNNIRYPNRGANAAYMASRPDESGTREYTATKTGLDKGLKDDLAFLNASQPGERDKNGNLLKETEQYLADKKKLEDDAANAAFINAANYYEKLTGVGANAFKGITSAMIAMYGQQSKQARTAFIAYKAMMIAQTVIATARGVMEAVGTSGNIYVGIALAAVTAAMGAMQVAKIAAEPMPQAHGGLEYVPEDATYKLSKGERVLAPRQNEAFMKLNRDLSAQMQRNPQGIGSPSSGSKPTIVKPQIKVINVDYSSQELSSLLQSSAGEEIVVNHMVRNKESLA